jgi:glycosyltransferase involved in cell wall biosynthesis
VTGPAIAVVVPAYNAGRWIDETLESVLAQTRPPAEVVVVDDGSTDDTAERARAHGVTVIEQSNGGPPAAYNRAIEAASAEYVAMCPADDIWAPHKLEWQAQTLAEHPDTDVLFARAQNFGLSDEMHPHPRAPGRQEQAAFLRAMYEANLVPAPTVVLRRSLHGDLGRFDESLPSEDYEFWLRALSRGASFFYDPRVMVKLRVHGGNVSLRALEIWEMNHALRRRYAGDVADPELSRRLQARDLREIARCRLGAGRPADARVAYVDSWRERPSAEAAVGAALLAVPVFGRALSRLNERRRGR